jgi:hypothetical protein
MAARTVLPRSGHGQDPFFRELDVWQLAMDLVDAVMPAEMAF